MHSIKEKKLVITGRQQNIVELSTQGSSNRVAPPTGFFKHVLVYMSLFLYLTATGILRASSRYLSKSTLLTTVFFKDFNLFWLAAVETEMLVSLDLLPHPGVADFQGRSLFLIHLLT